MTELTLISVIQNLILFHILFITFMLVFLFVLTLGDGDSDLAAQPAASPPTHFPSSPWNLQSPLANIWRADFYSSESWPLCSGELLVGA